MSILADIPSSDAPVIRTGWQLFRALATGELRPGRAWQNPAYRRKFVLRSLLMPVSTASLLSGLAKHPDLLPMLHAQPGLPCRLHRPWLSLVMDKKRTLEALSFHYQAFSAHLSAPVRMNYFTSQGITLAELSGKNEERYTIRLVADANLDKEGEATLVFCDAQQTTLAEMTFALCEYQGKRTLFIGGLQGAKANVAHDAIQFATKACHGLFPKRLLLEACTGIAAFMEMEQIVAVSNTTHIYKSLRYRKKKQGKLFADYDSFWLSLAGEQHADGAFLLPSTIVRKPMEEIASKKRSEYRRRYELLDALQAQVTRTLRT
ncbi:VirK/YbjX family protein [Yokenella regensburgei]|uniref:VirK/YbjX family protein n=1 Tax=Yokenella regensburgei TaxID=158877 RepID=UPI003F15C1D7